jgi:DNA-binding MarR family transcriptional regulator
MVVHQEPAPIPSNLDLGYLALFFGLRMNEMVMERMAAEGFGDVRESHGYVIQHLIETDRSITELAERMEVTQQAASKVVAELTSLGILEAATGEDRRSKRIALSKRGREAVAISRKIRKQVESKLIKELGADRYGEAKSILLQALKRFGGLEPIRARRIRAPR